MAQPDPQTPKPSSRRSGRASWTGARSRLERGRTVLLVGVQIVLILTVFFQLNYLSCRRHTAWDLTQNRRFSVSETTGQILEGLGVQVQIVMAFLGSSELYPEVKGLLGEYDRLGGDRVTVEYLDLSRSRARIAELRDLHGIEFTGDQIVVIGENGRVRTLPAEELVNRDVNSGMVLDFKGEEIVTAAVLEVTEQRQRKIYLLTGDRRAEELVRIAEQIQPLANAQNARLEGLVLEGREAIPEDADVLFFPGNVEDLTQRELELVRDYWDSGSGGLVIFLDPSASTPNLNSLLRQHGVAPRADRVLSVVSIPGVAARKTFDVPVSLMPGPGPNRDRA
ncbi:MAG TPA: Gldg family protein, partial [Bacteroidia bacterium]|nr:Gldg family protein [Bacteroidia bacterium]